MFMLARDLQSYLWCRQCSVLLSLSRWLRVVSSNARQRLEILDGSSLWLITKERVIANDKP